MRTGIIKRRTLLNKKEVLIVHGGFTQLKSTCIVCSLGEELVKFSIELPRQSFWLIFMILLETISGLIMRMTLIRT